MRVLRVALVDDHADIRRLIGVLVAAAGHQVVGEAADGREGVAVVLGCMPDLVIMDWQMPEMDGVEATRQICRQAPTIRVIAFSSANDPSTRTAFLDAGAVAYHDKGDITGLEASIARAAGTVRPAPSS